MKRMPRGFRYAVWQCCLLVCAGNACAADLADCSFVDGWEQQGATRHYTPGDLSDYIDGNAESYIAYGFVQMQGVTCKSRVTDTLVIDVSEMVDADAAYGILKGYLDPGQPLAKIGMGGQILPRRGSFAKGNYYVEITADYDDQTSEVADFLTVIEKQIDGRSTVPDALSWFPPEKLASVRLVPERPLGLRVLKRAYVAQYDHGKAFVALEATPEGATATMAQLRRLYPGAQPVQLANEAFHVRERYLGGTCFFRKGRYVGGYTNMRDGPTAVSAAALLAARMP